MDNEEERSLGSFMILSGDRDPHTGDEGGEPDSKVLHTTSTHGVLVFKGTIILDLGSRGDIWSESRGEGGERAQGERSYRI